jgi:ATP/maltotriose-dependent transcriptional regulator MalT
LGKLSGDPGATRGNLRWLWQACVLALELWDDDSAYVLSGLHLQTARETGALTELPLALGSRTPILVFCGDLAAAAALVEEARSVYEAAGIAEAPYGALTTAAWRGSVPEATALTATVVREASSRGEGVGVAISEYARAVLYNSLGRYDEALVAARGACADPQEMVAHNWGLTELVESATRTGRTDQAAAALDELTAKARATGTDWALGIQARSEALLSDVDAAENLFRRAVEHLSRARVRGEVARTHLVYGEWLRRADRRLDAREQLSVAYGMFSAMGMNAFAARTGRELVGTGATVPARTTDVREALSDQEAHFARLARDGLSNPEIGARLFLSPRTVEWHLRKVFTKLGIRSRRELRRALADRNGSGGLR